MLTIHALALGDYQTNCYILHPQADNRCVLIDPGFEPERVLAQLQRLGLKPEAILLTHGHFDHVGAVEALVAATGCGVYLHALDFCPPDAPGWLYPLAGCQPLFVQEGQTLHLAGLTLTVLHTPGHTPGSVCYLCQNALLSGDTLFAGSCGRMDLPGGDPAQMRRSLTRLAQLTEDLTVHPGHGPETSLQEEKGSNPYL